MRQATALFLFAAAFAACSAGTPVGFFDSNRVAAESVTAHAALDGPDQVLRRAQLAAQQAQDAAGRADELTAAARRADADKAMAALGDAQKARLAAGNALDDRISVIVSRLAADRKMSVIIGGDGKLPYAAPGTDLTAELIAALDSGAGELARARRAAAAASKKVRELEAKETNAPPVRRDGGK